MSMRTKLLCALVLAVFLGTTISMAAELEGVKIGTGTLKMGGVFQAQLYLTNWDNNTQSPMYGSAKYTTFRSYRARFLFWGVIVPDKVKYFVQLEMLNIPAFLDYKMMFLNYIPKTSVTVGRFLPYWTLYMHKAVSDLELIHYPMVVNEFAMGRQPGIQTETTIDPIKFYVGCFNGADIPDSYTDNNNAKDFMFRLDVMPKLENMNLLVGGEFWMGRRWVDANHTKGTTMFGPFASLDMNKLKLRGEYLMRTFTEGYLAPGDVDLSDRKSSGFYFMAGYTALDWLEVLGRYDAYDPNTANDADDFTDEDGNSAITIGANFMIHKYNAVIALNLVMNSEQSKIPDVSTTDPLDETDLKNDEAVVQFQIAF